MPTIDAPPVRLRIPGSLGRSWRPTEVLARCPDTGRPLTALLDTGHRAEYMRTKFDCLRAALATAAGVPYAEVPDVGTPESDHLARTQAVADLGAWARGLGYRLTWHEQSPVERMLWIGAVPADEDGPSHAAVMCKSHVIHDPAAFFPLPHGHVPVPVSLADIESGLTLDLLELP